MHFLKKSNEHDGLADAMLLTNDATYIFPLLDGTTLQEFTNVKLELLFLNTTGKTEVPTLTRYQLIQCIFDIANLLSNTPTGAQKFLQCTKTAKMEALILNIATNNITTAVNNPVKTACKPPPPSERGVSGASTPTKGQGSPKAGTIKDLVWACAEEFWEKEGKPTDLRIVGAMRKRIMKHLLETQDICTHKTSNALGKWQKQYPIH